MRASHSLLASTAIAVALASQPLTIKLSRGHAPFVASEAKAGPQPCQWQYSFDGNGNAVANYCGATQSASEPSNVVSQGCDVTGHADCTPTVQGMLNKGLTSIYFPPGNYQICGVKIPHTAGLHIFGNYTASKINQFAACAKPAFYWDTTAMDYSEQTISDLLIEADGGAAHTIDTTGEGGLSIHDIFFTGVPTGFDNIFANGTANTYNHDINIWNIFAYSAAGGTHGSSNIEFGNLASDSKVTNLVANGAFVVDQGIKMNAGTETITVSNSHPYNYVLHVLAAAGCLNCQFLHNTWDNSETAVLSLTNVVNSLFTGEQIEAVNNSQDGIILNNSSGNVFTGLLWGTNGGAGNNAVHEIGTSDYNQFRGGNLSPPSWTEPAINLLGPHSYSEGIAGYTSLGQNLGWQGVTATAQAQNTSQFLGVNGGNSAFVNTAFSPYNNGRISSWSVAVSAAPPTGQTMTFLLMDGSTQLSTCTITAGLFGCKVEQIDKPINPLDQVYITSTFSATSGAATVRYVINFQG